MSKKLFSFMLGELSIVRLICNQPKCGAIAEMPIARLVRAASVKCPCCQMPYEDENDGPLKMLGKAIHQLKQQKDVDVEFVLPDTQR